MLHVNHHPTTSTYTRRTDIGKDRQADTDVYGWLVLFYIIDNGCAGCVDCSRVFFGLCPLLSAHTIKPFTLLQGPARTQSPEDPAGKDSHSERSMPAFAALFALGLRGFSTKLHISCGIWGRRECSPGSEVGEMHSPLVCIGALQAQPLEAS